MASSSPPQLPAYLYESHQQNQYIAIGICFPFAIAFVVLRLWSRRLQGLKLWIDDYLIVAALLADIGFMIAAIIMTWAGMGKHIETLAPGKVVIFLKGYIPGSALYSCAIGWTKLSILAFYWRIFSIQKTIKVPILILAFIVLGWNIAVFLLSIFGCTPVAFWWNRSIPGGRCIDQTAFLLGNSIPNICTDIAIFLLPIPYIWRLRQSRGKRLALTGVFLLAGFTCIITMIRLGIQVHIDFNSPDITWSIADFVVWTSVETNVAIVSANLPMLRPIYSLARGEKTTKSVAVSPRATIGGSNKKRRGYSTKSRDAFESITSIDETSRTGMSIGVANTTDHHEEDGYSHEVAGSLAMEHIPSRKTEEDI